jgi:hypothetical protein
MTMGQSTTNHVHPAFDHDLTLSSAETSDGTDMDEEIEEENNNCDWDDIFAEEAFDGDDDDDQIILV